MYEVVRTGTSEANDRCSSRFSVNDEELVGRVWSWWSEEVIEGPLQSVKAVLAVVYSHHHHRFLFLFLCCCCCCRHWYKLCVFGIIGWFVCNLLVFIAHLQMRWWQRTDSRSRFPSSPGGIIVIIDYERKLLNVSANWILSYFPLQF